MMQASNDETLQRRVLDDIIVDVYHLEIPQSRRTRSTERVRELAHVMQLVSHFVFV
jgi:hypothetical protein